MTEFNVIVWDINRDELITYDVLPYFRKEYSECRKKDRPHTREEWKAFVRRRGMYKFWGQCQWEFQISAWPPIMDFTQNPPVIDPKKDKRIKIDVWQQIENNLDIVVELLMNEYTTAGAAFEQGLIKKGGQDE